MQSVCLDEFGGEKAVDPASQETTLIQHIFGGHLQSQVLHPCLLKPIDFVLICEIFFFSVCMNSIGIPLSNTCLFLCHLRKNELINL